MNYYAVVTKTNDYVMTKSEWKDFSTENPNGNWVRKCKTKEDAEQAIVSYKSKRPVTKVIKPEDSNYMCFYDSEFNAYNYKTNSPQEIVSIGLAITDKDGTIIDTYYSLIHLKVASKLTSMCKKITGLTQEDMESAPEFATVCEEICDFIAPYGIDRMYALGKDDLQQFYKMRSLYKYSNTTHMVAIEKRIANVRGVLRRFANQEIGDMGLKYLKQVCNLEGDVKHNALDDAIDLANVYHTLRKKGYCEERYQEIIERRRKEHLYTKSRNVENERVYAPNDVIKAKDILVDYLRGLKDTALDPLIIRAMADDLEAFIVSND